MHRESSWVLLKIQSYVSYHLHDLWFCLTVISMVFFCYEVHSCPDLWSIFRYETSKHLSVSTGHCTINY